MANKITAAEVRRRIGIQFGGSGGTVAVPEHLVLFEVGARGQGPITRRIDAVAVGMLKRTDYLIHGFEIKISRGDLRSELADSRKAADAARYCDRWWLAVGDIDLIRPADNIPPGWGIIACSDRGLRVHREPAPIERIESPQFRAALLHAGQRASGYRRAMGFQAGYQRGKDESRVFYEARARRFNALAAMSAAVEEETA